MRTKRIFLWSLAMLGISISTLAQTNTFPSSGNVGIGTLAPEQHLHLFQEECASEVAGLSYHPTIRLDHNFDILNFGLSRRNTWDIVNWGYNGTSSSPDGLEFRFRRDDLSTGDGSCPIVTPSSSFSTFMKLTVGGNLGIGIDAPSERLHVDGTAIFTSLAGTGTRMVTADATGRLSTIGIPTSQTLSISGNLLSISGGNSITLPSSADNLGNHTATTSLNLNSNSITNVNNLNFSGGGNIQGVSSLQFVNGVGFTPTGGGINLPTRLYTNQMSIGTFGTSYDLELANNSAAKPTSSSWTVSSDRRLKSEISPFTDGLSQLRKINPIWFTYNGMAGMPKETGVGTIAQELEKVAPYMIRNWQYRGDNGKTETYLAVDYGAMDFMLINSIKELDSLVSMQKLEITLLKQKLAQIESGNPSRTDIMNRAELDQNIPNPSNSSTIIKYRTEEKDVVQIVLTDLSGKLIQTYNVKPGSGELQVFTSTLAPGIYVYSLVINGSLFDSKKMMVDSIY